MLALTGCVFSLPSEMLAHAPKAMSRPMRRCGKPLTSHQSFPIQRWRPDCVVSG